MLTLEQLLSFLLIIFFAIVVVIIVLIVAIALIIITFLKTLSDLLLPLTFWGAVAFIICIAIKGIIDMIIKNKKSSSKSLRDKSAPLEVASK